MFPDVIHWGGERTEDLAADWGRGHGIAVAVFKGGLQGLLYNRQCHWMDRLAWIALGGQIRQRVNPYVKTMHHSNPFLSYSQSLSPLRLNMSIFPMGNSTPTPRPKPPHPKPPEPQPQLQPSLLSHVFSNLNSPAQRQQSLARLSTHFGTYWFVNGQTKDPEANRNIGKRFYLLRRIGKLQNQGNKIDQYRWMSSTLKKQVQPDSKHHLQDELAHMQKSTTPEWFNPESMLYLAISELLQKYTVEVIWQFRSLLSDLIKSIKNASDDKQNWFNAYKVCVFQKAEVEEFARNTDKIVELMSFADMSFVEKGVGRLEEVMKGMGKRAVELGLGKDQEIVLVSVVIPEALGRLKFNEGYLLMDGHVLFNCLNFFKITSVSKTTSGFPFLQLKFGTTSSQFNQIQSASSAIQISNNNSLSSQMSTIRQKHSATGLINYLMSRQELVEEAGGSLKGLMELMSDRKETGSYLVSRVREKGGGVVEEGLGLMREGRYNEALGRFERAMEVKMGYQAKMQVASYKALCLHFLEKYNLAVVVHEEILKGISQRQKQMSQKTKTLLRCRAAVCFRRYGKPGYPQKAIEYARLAMKNIKCFKQDEILARSQCLRMICQCLLLDKSQTRQQSLRILSQIILIYNDARLTLEQSLTTLQLADGHRRCKQYKLCLQTCLKSKSLLESLPTSNQHLSQLYFVLGENSYDWKHYEQAVRYFEKAIELKPQLEKERETRTARMHFFVGMCLREMGRLEQARERLRVAMNQEKREDGQFFGLYEREYFGVGDEIHERGFEEQRRKVEEKNTEMAKAKAAGL